MTRWTTHSSSRSTRAHSKVSIASPRGTPTRRPAIFASLIAILILPLLFAGCSTLDERQRAWIFQPSDRNWGVADNSLQEVWIDFQSKATGRATKLNGLWLPAEPDAKAAPLSIVPLATTFKAAYGTPFSAEAAHPENGAASNVASEGPILLYLHGARWNVSGSTFRMRRMQELGFSVLGVDYRGFGKSSPELPSEKMAYEDARAAWDWLAAKYPDRPRYIFGHSLGGPIAINLAAEVQDESGTMVEGTFSSMADVVSSFKWGWMPIGPRLTQRFEAVRKVGHIGSPLLVVHGGQDQLIKPDLGKKLFDAAAEPKRFVLVENGSHHNTNSLGQNQYREAIAELFGLPAQTTN